MIKEFVALDLETTGFDPVKDEIIEVGLVKFHQNQIINTYSTLIRPNIPLPNLVSYLTNIDENSLEKAPFWEEKKHEIQAFLNNTPLIGQNLSFDVSFLQKKHLTLSQKQFDTMALARILEHSLPSFKLSYLADYFQVELKQSHRALDDALTAAKIFQKMLAKLQKMAPQFLAQFQLIGQRTPKPWFVLDLLPVLKEKVTAFSVPARIFSQKNPSEKSVLKQKFPLEQLQKILPENTKELFDLILLKQKNVKNLLVNETHSIEQILLSIALFFSREKARHPVIISTANLNKQQQVLETILKLQDLLNSPVSFQGIKSQKNYLCPERFRYFLEKRSFTPDQANFAAKILIWLKTTSTGDCNELNLNKSENEIWNQINSDPLFCEKNNCENQSQNSCWKWKDLDLQNKDFLLCQHALLLENPSIVSEKLLILLEADQLEIEATKENSIVLAQNNIVDLLKQLLTAAENKTSDLEGQLSLFKNNSNVNEPSFGLLNLMLFSFRKQNLNSSAIEIIEDLSKLLAKNYAQIMALWENLRDLITSSMEINLESNYQNNKILLKTLIQNNSHWPKMLAWWKTNQISFSLSAEKITHLTKALEGIKKQIIPKERIHFSACLHYLQKFSQLMEILVCFLKNTEDNWIRWLDWSSDLSQISIRLTPFSIKNILENLYEKPAKTFYVAASWEVDQETFFPAQKLHLPQKFSLIKNPYPQKSRIIIPADLVDVDGSGRQKYLAEKIAKLHDANGITLAIFPTQNQLLTCYEKIRQDNFIKDSELLALNMPYGFWQIMQKIKDEKTGVYLLPFYLLWSLKPFSILKKALLAKVPFSSPKNPIMQFRSQSFENSFDDYILPLTILNTQKTIAAMLNLFPKSEIPQIYLLDSRLKGKNYGQRILDNLQNFGDINLD